ncbi:MAG: hypothetical protein FJ125_11480, partial [Deltaproteobacteria bacterium]|nr:hypothetical protein [Deltaproteobacteria bacterium]
MSVDAEAAKRRVLYRISHWIEGKILGCVLTIVFLFVFAVIIAGVGYWVHKEHLAGRQAGKRAVSMAKAGKAARSEEAGETTGAVPAAEAMPTVASWDGRSTFLWWALACGQLAGENMSEAPAEHGACPAGGAMRGR